MLPQRMMKVSCVLACAILGCVSPNLASEEQSIWNSDGEDPDGEVIEVEGEAPFDPNWEGPDQGAPADQGEPSGGGGGYGGSGEPSDGATGGPGDQPERKECTPDLGHEGCYACCMYNHEHVDGWECRRKKSKKAKARCWREASDTLGQCQRGCPPAVPPPPPPIVTVTGAP